jgi:hypothetical protein
VRLVVWKSVSSPLLNAGLAEVKTRSPMWGIVSPLLMPK